MRVSTMIRSYKGVERLVDTGRRFRFAEVEGEVTLVNGVAAGTAFLIFKFHGGPLDGKELACEEWGRGYYYQTNTRSDGMEFNLDPVRKAASDDDWGGDYVPEYDGTVFHVHPEE